MNSSEPLQHVKAVELYIYEMEPAATTPESATDFETRIQDATLCATETLPWKSQSTSSGVSMSYKIQKPLQENREYVFLAVGMDAESEENYTFPSSNEKFSGAVAALKEGKNITDMAVSEFFSGYQVAKYMRAHADEPLALYPLVETDGSYEWDTANGTQIELNRAVSGVLLYLTDIPARLSKEGKNYRVTKFELVMHQSPATEVSLHDTKISSTPDSDLGTTLITSMDLSELNYDPATDGDLYKIEGQKGEVETLPNTLLYGAYVLPTAKSTTADTPTFSIQLYGKQMEVDGSISSGENSETRLESFPAMLEGDSNSSFDIVRNHIYCIGQKPVADDTEGDAPVSLAGKKITVKAVPWTGIGDNIEFPYVDTNAKFNPDFDPGYVFNCINASFQLSVICNSNSKWQLSVPDGCDWLYIRQTDGAWGKTYTQERLPDEDAESNSKDLTLFMMDYAEYRASYENVDINNDIRTIDLELRTMGYDETTGKESIVKTTTLTIRQYNAISVTFGKNNQYRVGFSRLDVGDEFYKSSKEAEADMKGQGKEYDGKWIGVAHTTGRKAYGWGYWGTAKTSVIWENEDSNDCGKVNLKELRHTDNMWDNNLAISESITISASNNINNISYVLTDYKYKYSPVEYETDFWYLPARNELSNFLYAMKAYDDKNTFTSNLVKNGYYWTSNPCYEVWIDRESYKASYAYYYSSTISEKEKPRICGIQRGDSGNDEYYDSNYESQPIYIRPCKSLN